MRTGLAISLILHGAILAFALGLIGGREPLKPPKIDRIEVEIVSVSDLTRIKAGTKSSPKKRSAEKTTKAPARTKAKTPPKPKASDKAAQTKPKKVAALPPKPREPKPRAKEPARKKAKPEKPKPAPKLSPKPKKDKKKKPAKKKLKKKKSKAIVKKRKRTPPVKRRKKTRFDPDRIAALLNRVPDAAPDGGRPKRQKKKSKTAQPEKRSRPALGQPLGIGERLTISEFDFFMRQISECWNPPVGAFEAGNLVPVIAFRLKRDGTVDGTPTVVNPRSSPFFEAAANAAIRAILACQPYDLPIAKYKDWASNEITFDPNQMLGG